MSELATETLERHEHLKHNPDDGHGKIAALVIGVLAATLAVCEMAERSSQNNYLALNISASDEYAFYQARQNRALILNQTATLLSVAQQTPDTQKQAASAALEAKRLLEDTDHGNSAKQILARAAEATHQRDHNLHKYEWYEIVTSTLQIAIVLASVSVVTQLSKVLYTGIGIGALAAGLGILVAVGLV